MAISFGNFGQHTIHGRRARANLRRHKHRKLTGKPKALRGLVSGDKLDTFTRSYVETALWAETDNATESGGEPLDRNYTASDIDEATLEKMKSDCATFQRDNSELLSESELPSARAGRDFWLSRNGHGTGFWDEDFEQPRKGILDRLHKAAKSHGTFDLYVGDDGKIYGTPL